MAFLCAMRNAEGMEAALKKTYFEAKTEHERKEMRNGSDEKESHEVGEGPESINTDVAESTKKGNKA